MNGKRFNLSVRTRDDGGILVDLHDREKEGLYNPPFADKELGGGILSTTNVLGTDMVQVNEFAAVRDVLNALDELDANKCSPSVIRALAHMVEQKQVAAHIEREYLDPWHGFGAYKVPVEA